MIPKQEFSILIHNTPENWQWLIDKGLVRSTYHQDLRDSYVRIKFPYQTTYYAAHDSATSVVLDTDVVEVLMVLPDVPSMVYYLIAEKLLHQFHPITDIVYGWPYNNGQNRSTEYVHKSEAID